MLLIASSMGWLKRAREKSPSTKPGPALGTPATSRSPPLTSALVASGSTRMPRRFELHTSML